MALEKELGTYRKLIEDGDKATEHHGEYVLITGEKIVGFYTSLEDALQEGYAKFDPGSFLVKRVSTIEEAHFVSRPLTAPCLTSAAK